MFSDGRKLAAPRSVCHNEMCAGKDVCIYKNVFEVRIVRGSKKVLFDVHVLGKIEIDITLIGNTLETKAYSKVSL